MDETDDVVEWYRLEVTSRYGARFAAVRVTRYFDGRTDARALVARTAAVTICDDMRTGTISLSVAEWDEFLALLDTSRFWELPEGIQTSGKWFDGPTCELTGCRAGEVHRVWRYQPSEDDGESLVGPVHWLEGILNRAVGGYLGCI